MPLDALDQKTLNSLPRLSEVYDAYGVQVNALSVNEIFALYERTGFLYPDKAARLLPHLGQVRENWRRDRKSTRLNSSHSQISYAVFCLKKKKQRKLGLTLPAQRALIDCTTYRRRRTS